MPNDLTPNTAATLIIVFALAVLLVGPTPGQSFGEGTSEPIELVFARPPMQEVLPPAHTVRGPFTINLNLLGGLTSSQQAAFTAAKAAWESRISGYQPGINLSSVTISAQGVAIDGPGGILGSAGPTFYTIQSGYYLTTQGQMQFDSADLASLEAGGALGEVIEHEMGHVLGIGIWWEDNNAYTGGSYQYTGPAGLSAWKANFSGQGAATSVPVEDQGGAGTAEGHWNESLGGAQLVGITENGKDMRNELMTGWLNSPTFYSSLTHQHLEDLGFTVYPVAQTLFEDGFESGNTNLWSASTL